MANTISRTVTAEMSAGEGYKPGGSSVSFNRNISAGTSYSVTVSKITASIEKIKTFYGRSRFTIYINDTAIGTTSWFDATGGTLSTLTSTLSLSSGKNTAINSSVNSVSIGVETEGNTYFYNSSDGHTKLTLTVEASVGDPTAPTTVKLNNTAGNIHVPANSNVTLEWSGASGGTNNPIAGYEIYKNNFLLKSVGASTSSTSVDCPSAGSSFVYKVKTIGQRSDSGFSTERTVYSYSNPNAPTNITANPTISDAGTNVVLSWSGASAGSGNNVVGYKVYRATVVDGTYEQYGNQVSSSPMNVPSHSTMGETYYYKVATVGQYSESGLSDAYAEVVARVYTNVVPPNAVVCTPNLATSDTIVSLSWSGAEGGTNTSVASYEVYRSASPNSGYEFLESVSGTSCFVNAPSNEGQTYYYKVKAIANKSGFDSDLSSAYGFVSVPLAPNAPVIQGTLTGKSYNSRPRVLAIVPPATVEGVIQSVVATGWTASRSNLEQGQKVVLRKNTAYSGSGSDDVVFSSRDSFGVETGATVTIEHEVPVWTDDPVVAGTTYLKADHMNELRQAIDDIRAWYGMEEYEWQEEIIAGVTSSVNWVSHAMEIKSQIEEIQAFVNSWDSTNSALDISLSSIPQFYFPRADVINKLREAIGLL